MAEIRIFTGESDVYQSELQLEPVGRDIDGHVKSIEELSYRPAEMRYDTKARKPAKTNLVGSTICLLGLAATGIFYVASAYFEATAYNRLTGSSVTTWDAVWLDLRVNGTPATEKR